MNQLSAIRLVVRADDAGSLVSANEAIEQSVDAGLVQNVSLMVPGPAFPDAAERFAGRDDICFGLHITLNSELNSPRWGPVSPPEAVPSLVDANGHFFPNPNLTLAAGFALEDAGREIKAQLHKARAAGFKISYVDEHMAVSRIGLRPFVAELCRREHLIDVHGLPRLALGTTLDSAIEGLGAADSGVYVWVTHPGIKTADTRKLHSLGQPDDGSFARNRDAERRLLGDPLFHALLRSRGVQTARYADLLG